MSRKHKSKTAGAPAAAPLSREEIDYMGVRGEESDRAVHFYFARQGEHGPLRCTRAVLMNGWDTEQLGKEHHARRRSTQATRERTA